MMMLTFNTNVLAFQFSRKQSISLPLLYILRGDNVYGEQAPVRQFSYVLLKDESMGWYTKVVRDVCQYFSS